MKHGWFCPADPLCSENTQNRRNKNAWATLVVVGGIFPRETILTFGDFVGDHRTSFFHPWIYS